VRDAPGARQGQPYDRLVSWLQLGWAAWGVAGWTVVVGVAGVAADRAVVWIVLGLVWAVGTGLVVMVAWSQRREQPSTNLPSRSRHRA
jgi:hypothetical protein